MFLETLVVMGWVQVEVCISKPIANFDLLWYSPLAHLVGIHWQSIGKLIKKTTLRAETSLFLNQVRRKQFEPILKMSVN